MIRIKIKCPKCKNTMLAPAVTGSHVATCGDCGLRRGVIISQDSAGAMYAKFRRGRTKSGLAMVGAALKVYPFQAEWLAEYGLTPHRFLHEQFAEWAKDHPRKA